ncbi:MAG TPA: FAD:protein FMN transferase [Chitinispirillaceae bacterium]|nr:FAD:protein FMN transferase [Chitinispirillaceae bacterium]
MWKPKRYISEPCINHFQAMGTIISQEVYGINASRTVSIVTNKIKKLDTLWSPYRKGNLINRLHKAAGIKKLQVDCDTFKILQEAKKVSLMSGGTFDITADPLIRLWRDSARKKTVPSKNDIDLARNLTDINDLVLSDSSDIFLLRKGQGIDLGGIGKGYAADKAREIYVDHGIRHALINLGGNVLALNSKPDGSPWKIGIRIPEKSTTELVGYIEACNCSIVTSGDYERFFDYKDNNGLNYHYHHIIDPRTGEPAKTGVSSVTVVSYSSTICDILATSAFILGIEQGMALCDSFENTHSLIIDKNGKMFMSDGMSKIFHKN